MNLGKFTFELIDQETGIDGWKTCIEPLTGIVTINSMATVMRVRIEHRNSRLFQLIILSLLSQRA